MKFNKLNETYWIDSKEVMDQVSKLGKELEADGFKFYGDRYSGSTYYDFYTKRGDNGAICKAVQYSYDGAQLIDITVDQLIGKEPIDGFEAMRRKLGKMLLPQNEAVEEDKEDKFVLYFPYLEPKIISKDRAIKQMEFELNEFKNSSGASVAGRGFGIYCLQSYDPDTDSVWTGRYSSKEFLKVLDESMLREAFDTTVDFPYMFFYNCNNPTFGYDFQLFASSLGARKVYGRYKGTGAGTYFYLVPSEEVYEKLKAVAKDKYTVKMQRLLPYNAEEYPKIQYIKESFEMAAGGDDFDGEIAAMRQEQTELERRRAARKERFALMHKLFDDKMNADPDARWIDKVYHIFDTAESVTFVGDKYGRIPGRTEDKQPIRYRYSIEEYDFYSDPYWEIIYVGTNNVDPLKEDLEDDFDLYMKASDFKCKLSRYDVEEAANPDELIIYMEDVYSILSDEYGAENIKWWKFYEDDDVDFGYKVCLKDGSKHIVEINNDRVDEVNEALEEERKTQYVICGVTNEGTRMLYDAVNDNFTTDYDSATKYDDMDVARDDWFKIPRSGFRRIFIPVYDPAVFESLNEGSGAATAHVASDALKIAAQGDKHKWAKTASEIIDVIPDEFADQVFDVVKEKASDIKLSAENKKKLVDASNGELTEKDVEDCDTLGKIFAFVDTFEWAKKNPGLLKGFVMTVLAIIAVVEPTPVVEVITIVMAFLPEKWVAKILAIINLTTPTGLIGTGANKIYKAVKKKHEAFDADRVQKRIACTTEFDNGHVFHNDYFMASSADAEERAKKASIENPDKVFYVKYDDVMNPSSDIKWKNGEQITEDVEDGDDFRYAPHLDPDGPGFYSDEDPIYFDPDDEFEVDFRYYVYANNNDVVSDAFDFEEDAIAWAQENNYPIVKIHNYYRDTDGELNPDGDPEVVWEA